jgi:hypothetical protein
VKELLQTQSLDQSQDGSDYIYSEDVSISEETAIDKILPFSCFTPLQTISTISK